MGDTDMERIVIGDNGWTCDKCDTDLGEMNCWYVQDECKEYPETYCMNCFDLAVWKGGSDE